MNDLKKMADLDLIVDKLVGRMNVLCGEAVKEKVSRNDVLNICGIDPKPCDPAGDPWGLEKLMYADSLLNEMFNHLATRWGQFRDAERRPHSAATPTYDDESDFE
jgi:hypothetical protein